MMQFCMISLKSRQKRTKKKSGKLDQFFLFNSTCWHLLTVTTGLTLGADIEKNKFRSTIIAGKV